MEKIQISEVVEFNSDLVAPIHEMLVQLTGNPDISFTKDALKELVLSDNSHLFVMTCDGKAVGMLTVGTYLAPTGTKAWIEDVVVNVSYRGRGLSKRLLIHAIEFLEENGISAVVLTSKPERIIANRLYPSVGFYQRKTNVYKKELGK